MIHNPNPNLPDSVFWVGLSLAVILAVFLVGLGVAIFQLWRLQR